MRWVKIVSSVDGTLLKEASPMAAVPSPGSQVTIGHHLLTIADGEPVTRREPVDKGSGVDVREDVIIVSATAKPVAPTPKKKPAPVAK